MATVTIDPADLAAHPYGDSKPTLLVRTRSNEQELPVAVEISFANLDVDYEKGHEIQQRQITDSKLRISIELPLAFRPDGAAQVADILLSNHWVERVSYELQLPFFKYWFIEPTDVLDLTFNGTVHSIRVTDIEYDLSRVIKVKGVANDASVYTSNAKGAVATQSIATIPVTGPTFLKLMNLPPLLVNDRDFSGYVLVIGGYLSGWRSAQVLVSYDGGATYSILAQSTQSCTFGVLTSALASAPTTNTWDISSRINVRIENGTLSSDTDLNVLAGANTAYIDGEILRFATASLVASSTYRLSRLLRGIRGTDASAVTHSKGTDFVMLDSSIFRVAMADSYRNVELSHKVDAPGLTHVAITSFAGTSQALVPFSPVNIKGARNTARDLTISWHRRDRVYGEWTDYVDIGMSEAALLYDVEIVDASASVVRTYGSVITNSQVYNASAQTVDFGTVQGSVTVRVFQLSAAVGRGTGRSETI